MYLNTFATGVQPIDLTTTEEFANLLEGARTMGVDFHLPVRLQSANTVANGLRFHYLEWGDKSLPPALFLHGGRMSAHHWDIVALALSDRYHIIALDQRGHGDSEWPRDGDVSSTLMADDAAKLIEQLGLQQPALVAHSAGGRASMKLLSGHPGLVSRFVMVDIGLENARLTPDGRGPVDDLVELDSIEEYIERVSRRDSSRSPESIRQTMGYNMMVRSDGKLVRKADSRRMERNGGSWHHDAPTWDDIARIDCPTLLVRGERSDVLAREHAEQVAAAFPDGRLVEVKDCGHNVHAQNPRGFLEAVVPFLKERA